MKERIMEYAEQARLHATIVHPDTHDIKVWGEVYHAKFAELILKECMDICDSTQAQYGQYTFTATTVKNRIKERFGVEE